MSAKGSKTTCSGLEWNEMLGLTSQLKKDGQWQDYLLLIIGCYVGLRASDLLNLKWEDVIGKSEILIEERKTGKSRNIRINKNCQIAIQYVWNKQLKKHYNRLDNYIFTNRKGKKISIQYVNRRLKITFGKYRVKTDNASTHTLRKTFGKRVFEMNNKSEESLIMLSLIFAHTSIGTTRRYLGITKAEIEDIYLHL